MRPQARKERKKKGKSKTDEQIKEAALESQEVTDPQEIVHKQIDLSTLGDNECRVETMARCSHQAHGTGFRIEIAEGGQRQALHMFTSKQEISLPDWMDHISSAISSTGGRVMDCRVPPSLVPTDEKGNTLEGGEVGAQRKVEEEAKTEETDWLSSMMGLSVGAPEKESKETRTRDRRTEGEEFEGGEADKAKAPGPEKELPPWLKPRPRRTRAGQAEGE